MSTPAAIVIHYSEIGLKGRNRAFFVNTLVRNVRQALRGLPVRNVQSIYGRLMVTLDPDAPDFQEEAIAGRLRLIPGLANFSFASSARVPLGHPSPEDAEAFWKWLGEEAWSVVERSGARTFVVRARRAIKEYPRKSLEIERDLGAEILERASATGRPLLVDLKAPQVTVRIEISHPFAFVYGLRQSGPGGLPVGSSGRLVSLLSSGFDSPVASYMMMKRGAEVVMVHFHAHPLTDRSSIDSVRELTEVLTRVQLRTRLYLIPFGPAQQEIIASTPRDVRMVVYRRMMMRIASEIARREGAPGLITGESLGQVASQTLSNMSAIDACAGFPVFRPLVGLNKDEIIAIGDQIGTSVVSSEPTADCCSLMVARHPVTRSSQEMLGEIEGVLDVDRLVREAVEQAEVEEWTDRGGLSHPGVARIPVPSGRRVRTGETGQGSRKIESQEESGDASPVEVED